MAVQDGQNVNAGVTNAAFMSRLQNTSTIGEVELDNTANPDSGDKITNAQRLINELKDVQGNVGEGDTTAKNYATNNVVTNGKDRKQAIEAIDATYNGTTGHNHDGTDGNGAKVSASSLDDFNNLFAEFGEYTFDAASGTSIDVSALFASQSAGGDDVTEGVITSAPNNYVPIVEKTNGGEIEDGEGDRVFSRLTESSGTWTLSFFTNESGTETAHNLSSQDIRFLYREVFTSANRPTIGANVGVYDTQSAIGDIPDASTTQRGVVSTSAQTLAGNKNFQDGLKVGGVDVVDLSSAQTMTNKTFGDEVTLTELGATPTTPGAGLMKIYPKTDKKMYKLDDTGAETELGAGGGGGGSGTGIRNFAQQFQNADSTTGYSTGQSATFDDTGTLGATFTVDSTTPIFGTDSLKLENIDANDWISIRDIAIDEGARGCDLVFKINYTYNGTDEPIVKVKDGDGNLLSDDTVKILDTTGLSKNQREARVQFLQPQSGTASEEVTVGFHFVSATGVEDFVFDEVIVSDQAPFIISEDPSKINEFNMSFNGTDSSPISPISENYSFVQNITRNSTGDFRLNFIPGMFVVAPTVVGSANGTNVNVSINSVTTTYADVWVRTTQEVDFNASLVNISVSRQGTDVVPLADRVSSFSSTVYKTRTSRTAVLKDVKASGVDGGTFTSGSWQTRDINNQSGGGSFCSISLNQITLQSGTYLIEIDAPAFIVNRHQCKLRNITDSVDEIIGASSRVDASGVDTTISKALGEITISGSKVFEVQHQCQTTRAGDGFGSDSNFGVGEIYTQVKIEKLD